MHKACAGRQWSLSPLRLNLALNLIEAQEYVVNKRSALDWLLERCDVRVDKDSHIENDYNQFALSRGTGTSEEQAMYIYNLILRVITVSLETNKIVKALPKLTIHPLDTPQR